MPIYLKKFQDFDQLAKTFSEDLHFTGKPVFQPTFILGCGTGQKEYIKEKLASSHGIAANLKFLSATGLLNYVLEGLIAEGDEVLLDMEAMSWKIFQLLQTEESLAVLEEVKKYCDGSEQKRMGLAVKTAQLFIKYQEEVPDLLREWQENKNKPSDWQEFLYRKLLDSEKEVADKTLSLEKLKKALEKKDNQERLRTLIPEVYLFEPEELSKSERELVKMLAEHLNINSYFLEVCSTTIANPVSSNWGVYGVNKIKELEKSAEVSHERSATSGNESLLIKIQTDFFNDSEPDRNFTAKEKDNSLLVYNSFTRVREVEALYNYLVKLVNQNGDIGARDIMVVIPNLHSYIAPIKTIFETTGFRFPYSIISRGFTPEDSFWSSLEQVIKFSEDQFTASGVYELVENKWIQEAFGFQDLDKIKLAIDRANIRRTYCGSKEDESHYSSWNYGLKRLIYGYSLGSETEIADPEDEREQMYPVDFAEGSDAQDLFRLYEFVEMLQSLIAEKNKTVTVAKWEAFCLQTAENFLNPEGWQLKKLQDLLENIRTGKSVSALEIDFSTWFFRFRELLKSEDVGRMTAGGGIIFSGLYPGVALPKKVVAFLGMNFREFPHKQIKIDFDKSNTSSNIHTDRDRYAFLKIFQNAREHVLLSYIGQDAKTNSEKPSSGVVDQLLDYAKNYTDQELTVKHKLHAYNSIYYPGDYRYFTYLANAQKAVIPKKVKEEESVEEKQDVFLFELVNFFKDPFKAHYNKTLGIYYDDEKTLRDTELFGLEKLEEWRVKQEMFDRFIEEEIEFSAEELKIEIEKIRKQFVIEGLLPLRKRGLKYLHEAWPKVTALKRALKNRAAANPKKQNLQVEIGKYVLYGEVYLTSRGEGLFFTVSNHKEKYRLEAYLKFLTLKASGTSDKLIYFALDKDQVVEKEILDASLSVEDARDILYDFIKMMKENLEELKAFCLDFGSIEEINKLQNKEDLLKFIKNKIDTYEKYERGLYPSKYFLNEHRRHNYFYSDYFLNNYKDQCYKVFEKLNQSFPA
ncbi:DNA helicase/exodeoxyribonuclease V, gamma subunit [Salegentibacter agarivorans]|uniref:DNA helicase/exodeoxyribonuclease V, gamma subunit n=1 Tax=Salegentibacter agarivorans TaxID=345907 RepID=A0A1I2MXB2_9FLAO|nr:exodeoxyribonuclease V subunit gamma [Salegentibacter agarivorans]SFF95758.1 DNA helicase/exodeoxyribonuclease V, gamma subunit [Salegentibacter agarivorans]